LSYLEELAHLTTTGQLSPSLASVAAACAGRAAVIHSAQATEALIEALAKVEHGPAAVILLQQLQAGLAGGGATGRRPLPGRATQIGPGNGEQPA